MEEDRIKIEYFVSPKGEAKSEFYDIFRNQKICLLFFLITLVLSTLLNCVWTSKDFTVLQLTAAQTEAPYQVHVSDFAASFLDITINLFLNETQYEAKRKFKKTHI